MEGRIGQDILRSLKPYQKEIEIKKRENPIQSTTRAIKENSDARAFEDQTKVD